MGRELQKKKNRSSIAKVKHRPKSKKLQNIRGNAVVAANWDRKLSLSQNYQQLGLAAKLQGRTGGTETNVAANAKPTGGRDGLLISSKKPVVLDPQLASVVRDPKTGAILEVLDQGGARRENPLNDPLNDLENDGEVEAIDGTGIMPQLEEMAANSAGPKVRKQSNLEQEWIERLVAKYGEDYSAMSRDSKLNVRQQTQGDIRKRVGVWMGTRKKGSIVEIEQG